jgi:hypothetical protein
MFMASGYIYEVNGQALEAPASCTWSLYFVSGEESGRDTLDGKMHIDDIAQKRKLSGITWSYPTKAQATSILQKFMAKRMMDIKYDDLLSGNIETRKFYMSDPTAQVYRWSDTQKHYVSLVFDLIEE